VLLTQLANLPLGGLAGPATATAPVADLEDELEFFLPNKKDKGLLLRLIIAADGPFLGSGGDDDDDDDADVAATFLLFIDIADKVFDVSMPAFSRCFCDLFSCLSFFHSLYCFLVLFPTYFAAFFIPHHTGNALLRSSLYFFFRCSSFNADSGSRSFNFKVFLVCLYLCP